MTGSWTVRSVMLGLAVLGLGVVWFGAGTPASAGDTAGASAASAVTATVLGADEAEYVGSKKCKMCHAKQYKSWEGTTHASALDGLKPGERAEAKTKAGLDPEKDYTTDETCLGCHVLGFGKKGGYEVLEDAD